MIGYVLATGGIAIMAVGFGIVDLRQGFLKGVTGNIIAGVGVACVVIGAALSLNAEKGEKKKGKGGEDEVPIYEGIGKKRKVVGYRKS